MQKYSKFSKEEQATIADLRSLKQPFSKHDAKVKAYWQLAHKIDYYVRKDVLEPLPYGLFKFREEF